MHVYVGIRMIRTTLTDLTSVGTSTQAYATYTRVPYYAKQLLGAIPVIHPNTLTASETITISFKIIYDGKDVTEFSSDPIIVGYGYPLGNPFSFQQIHEIRLDVEPGKPLGIYQTAIRPNTSAPRCFLQLLWSEAKQDV